MYICWGARAQSGGRPGRSEPHLACTGALPEHVRGSVGTRIGRFSPPKKPLHSLSHEHSPSLRCFNISLVDQHKIPPGAQAHERIFGPLTIAFRAPAARLAAARYNALCSHPVTLPAASHVDTAGRSLPRQRRSSGMSADKMWGIPVLANARLLVSECVRATIETFVEISADRTTNGFWRLSREYLGGWHVLSPSILLSGAVASCMLSGVVAVSARWPPCCLVVWLSLHAGALLSGSVIISDHHKPCALDRREPCASLQRQIQHRVQQQHRPWPIARR